MRVLLFSAILLAAAQPKYEPTSHYSVRNIEGWKVYVNNSLINEHGDLGDEVLELLRVKLYDINRTVPEKALKELHDVPIWVEYNDKKVRCACYHPSKKWLIENGLNPDKVKCVEIGNARTFIEWTLQQPSMVLHELTHAYHNRVLGDDQPDILAAFRRAKESKTYESVLHWDGKMRRAYALNNAKEYFAESTEAFFGQNDFYPFVRAELMKHDPQMYKTLIKVWGVSEK